MKMLKAMGLLVFVSVMAVSCASRSSVNAFGPYSAAETYYKQADYPKAIAQYQEYLVSNPKGNLAAIANYYIGKSYAASGDQAKAMEFYAKVMTDFPGTSWASFAKEQLARIQDAGQA